VLPEYVTYLPSISSKLLRLLPPFASQRDSNMIMWCMVKSLGLFTYTLDIAQVINLLIHTRGADPTSCDPYYEKRSKHWGGWEEERHYHNIMHCALRRGGTSLEVALVLFYHSPHLILPSYLCNPLEKANKEIRKFFSDLISVDSEADNKFPFKTYKQREFADYKIHLRDDKQNITEQEIYLNKEFIIRRCGELINLSQIIQTDDPFSPDILVVDIEDKSVNSFIWFMEYLHCGTVAVENLSEIVWFGVKFNAEPLQTYSHYFPEKGSRQVRQQGRCWGCALEQEKKERYLKEEELATKQEQEDEDNRNGEEEQKDKEKEIQKEENGEERTKEEEKRKKKEIVAMSFDIHPFFRDSIHHIFVFDHNFPSFHELVCLLSDHTNFKEGEVTRMFYGGREIKPRDTTKHYVDGNNYDTIHILVCPDSVSNLRRLLSLDDKEPIQTSLKDMFNNPHNYDVSFSVDGNSSKVYGHKHIICSSSQYFVGLFTFNQSSSSDPLHIHFKEIKYEVLLGIMEYIYTGEVNIHDQFVIDLLTTSSMFLLTELQEKCVNLVKTAFSPSNIVSICKLAKELQLPGLEYSSKGYMLVNKGKVEIEDESEEYQLENLKLFVDGVVASSNLNYSFKQRLHDLHQSLFDQEF